MKRLIAPLTVIALVAAGAGVWLNLGHWLSSADPLGRVDVVVVPAGDPDHRLPEAIALAREGVADRVWVTVREAGPVIEEADAVRRYASGRTEVEVIGTSHSLRDDAALVAERAPQRVAVVVAPWELARARITFQRLLRDTDVLVWPDGQRFDADRWWAGHGATVTFEVVKLVGILALFGARPVQGGESVPASLPLRAIAGGALTGALAGFVVRGLARRLGLVVRARLFRAHTGEVPLLGGAAILAGMAGGVVAGGGFSVGPAGAVAAGGVISLALVGFADDLVGLGARSRLVWSAAAGTAAWLLGLRVVVFAGGGLADDIGNAALTALWFVGVTHAMNVIDNLDGASGGVAAASSLAIAAVAFTSGQWTVAVGAAALAGACMGYLVHNVHPARLFMGDLGALGVGFALAALALALRPVQSPPVSFAVAVFALGVPIFDTTLVTVDRIRGGRSPWQGGTDHTSHRLVAYGLSIRQAAGVLWAAQLALGAAAFAVANTSRGLAWFLVVFLGLVSVGALALLLNMPALTPRTQPAVEVLLAIDRTVAGLRDVIRRARTDGWATTDRDTFRAAEEALRRLDAARKRFEG